MMGKCVLLSVILVTFLGGLATAQTKPAKPLPLRVGMVTDAGTIDDHSYNQATWEGLLGAKKDLKADVKYLKPAGTTESDYLKEIGNLYGAGFKFIITSGFKFETSVFKAQSQYKDAKFVLIDGSPNNGQFDSTREEKVAQNTVSIFFAEEQAGFIAGVASAVQIGQGAFGFIGGMEIPPVQKYNWGFQQGLQYANQNFGTQITMNRRDIIYQGTFSDVAAGQELSAMLYERGVKVIFAVAGGVGVGVINEAKARASSGAWVVGVDVDQFSQGEYETGHSVILTSAVKRVDVATFSMIKAMVDGKFPGGQTITLGVAADGVGLPRVNPNLGTKAIDATVDVLTKIRSGKLKVVAEPAGDLIRSYVNIDSLLTDIVPPMEGFETDEEYEARLAVFRDTSDYQDAVQELLTKEFEVDSKDWTANISDFDRKAKAWVISVTVTDPNYSYDGKVTYSLAGDSDIKAKFDELDQAIKDSNLSGKVTYQLGQTGAGTYESFGGKLTISEATTGSEIVTLELE